MLRHKSLLTAYRFDLWKPAAAVLRRMSAASTETKKKAVIFDMGGVLIPAVQPLVQRFAALNGLNEEQMHKLLFEGGDKSLWGRIECGELSAEDFPNVLSEHSMRILGRSVSDELVSVMVSRKDLSEPIPEALNAVRALRAEGIKTGLLTNNVFLHGKKSYLPVDRSLFDAVVESCVEGVRKPNPEIYKRMLDRLRVSGAEAVFLDDLGANLKAAKALGMATIKVTDIQTALKELGDIFQIPFGSFIPGTISVSPQHALPLGKLQEFLVATLHLHDDGAPIVLRKFKHGQSNPTYYIKFGGKEMVLRKKPPGKLLPSAHAVEREFRVMKALGEHGVPVPNCLCLCEDDSVLGTPFYVMEYVRGRFFDSAVPPDMSPEERRAIYRAMCQAVQKVHSVDIDKAGLSDFGKRGNYVQRQIDRWSRQYEASATHDIPAMNKLMEWLPKHAPSADTTTVVHGDIRIDNFIFHETEPKVIAILDWELSTLGDPISDLAYNCLLHHLPPDFPFMKGMAGLNLRQLGIPTDLEYMHEYCSSMRIPPVKDWNVYLALSFFRLAAISQGVYKRSLQGQASSTQAKHMGKLVEVLANLGCQFVGEDQRSAVDSVDSNVVQDGKSQFVFAVAGLRPEAQVVYHKVVDFMKNEVYPKEKELLEERSGQDMWKPRPALLQLKEKAKSLKLWNLFVPVESDPERKYGAGLTNLEYAFICEQMGKVLPAPEIFNCSAPDTGNMEVLIKYGTREQKDRWLTPLLSGEIRSCFGMTEPAVASSDATNIQASIRRDGEAYVINGRKWWTSGAMDSRCKLCVFMGKTDPDAPKHLQQSMILVPMDSPGVQIVRSLSVFNYTDAPSGHAEVDFHDVRVPVSNILLGEGRGFEIAQGRLGPGRIHHCMRLIGYAERALQLMIERAQNRVAFGKPLIAQGTIQEAIAQSRVDIEQARLLTLKAAHLMDTVGNKAAAAEIAMIKVVAPTMAQNVVDRAIQVFGGAGLSDDFPLAALYAWTRVLRLADGPDEVHKRSIARMEIRKQSSHL